MLIITGAAGFIASCLSNYLNEQGHTDLVLVDDFSILAKKNNYSKQKYNTLVERQDFIGWLHKNHEKITATFHLGARTDTTEFDVAIFDELNLNYSKAVWEACTKYQIPLIYASSAATYGLGEYGYEDRHDIVAKLKPLNPYGVSKNDFDKWVLQQTQTPPNWYGLKFFNVYGPNEFHKGRMASVIFHAFKQIKANGKVKLFRSHHPDFENGKQLRDFIYVKDLVKICYFLLQKKPNDGLYNVGTGQARTFLDLAKATFHALKLTPVIEFIDTPLDIRDKYQYYTQANMDKLRNAGYVADFTNLEAGIADYVQSYLVNV